jgi:hypothetical protein
MNYIYLLIIFSTIVHGFKNIRHNSLIQQIPRGCSPDVDLMDLLQASGACKRVQSSLYDNKHFDIFTNKEQLIRYITSFRNFTIISEGELGKDLFAQMNEKKYDTYYMDLNNLLDKNDIIYYLVKKYNTKNSGENVWVFKKEFLIGSREDALKLISKEIREP